MSGPTPPAARPKRATNVTVRRDLLAAAREAGINLSATLERALEEELAVGKRRQWRLEHPEGNETHNQDIRQHAPGFPGARTLLSRPRSGEDTSGTPARTELVLHLP